MRTAPINYGQRLKCKCGSKMFNMYVDKIGAVTTACSKCKIVMIKNQPVLEEPIQEPPLEPEKENLHI